MVVEIWCLWLCYKQGHLGVGNDDIDDDDDDYEKDDDDGLPKNQVKRRISSHGRTANELPNANVVANNTPSCLLYSLVEGLCFVE